MKIAITIDQASLQGIDRLVQEQVYPNRSQAIEAAVTEKLDRWRRTRLAEQCARLNPRQEQALAEEGLSEGMDTWPEY